MVGIDNVLAAIDKQFPDQSGEFYPAALQLQQGWNTPLPERFKGVRFNVASEVAAWLREHKKNKHATPRMSYSFYSWPEPGQ